MHEQMDMVIPIYTRNIVCVGGGGGGSAEKRGGYNRVLNSISTQTKKSKKLSKS